MDVTPHPVPRPRSTRHGRRRVGTAAATLVLIVGSLLVTSPAAQADPVYTSSATVTSSYTASYTATVSQPVSETATWGLPTVSQTVTGTAQTTSTQTSTQSATVTSPASGATQAQADATANFVATLSSQIQAYINAITVASVQAYAVAGAAMPSQLQQLQAQLYAQALSQAQATAVANTAPASTTPDAPVTNCGPTIYKADGTPWTCTFDDEFSGTSLNPSNWTTWNGVNYWGQSNVCYYDTPQNLSVSGGTLNLSVTKLAAGTQCSTPGGVTQPTYGAALVHSKGNFSQEYGRFSARIKFAGGNGIHNDFWLYSDGSSAGDPGEIDVAEYWGSLAKNMYGATHSTGTSGSDAGATNTCTNPDWSTGFHIYTVEWTPTTVTFIYDNNQCASWTIPRASLANPNAFSQNMFMILQVLADDGSSSSAPDATTTFPTTMQVDWVRVWK